MFQHTFASTTTFTGHIQTPPRESYDVTPFHGLASIREMSRDPHTVPAHVCDDTTDNCFLTGWHASCTAFTAFLVSSEAFSSGESDEQKTETCMDGSKMTCTAEMKVALLAFLMFVDGFDKGEMVYIHLSHLRMSFDV